MELVVAESLVAGIAAIAMSVAAFMFYRQIPPRRDFLSNREKDIGVWEGRFPECLTLAKTVLEEFCDAFCFARIDVWRFRPDDKIRVIYESRYSPGLGLPDALEYEELFGVLNRKFRIPKNSIHELWAKDPTLAALVECCVRYCDASDKTP
jgi:hypothetical protein